MTREPLDTLADAPRMLVPTAHELRCPACGTLRVQQFHEIRDVPANSCILMPTEKEARACLRSAITLTYCGDCGFVFNRDFSQARTEYSSRYEETQGFSGTFNRFHEGLARRLIEKYDLHGKSVLEIGCGKAEFLALLAQIGGNRCVGIDPGVKAERLPVEVRDRIQCIPDFYSEKYGHHAVDFLVCKMTLEHIEAPFEFMSTIRRGLGDQKDTVVFFQIPETMRILRECAFEDIYHEHCAYFTPGSLARLFRRTGFDVVALDVEYGAQYLTIEARPRQDVFACERRVGLEDDLAESAELVSSFPRRISEKLGAWREVLTRAHAEGKSIALWGSGSKAVSFLTALDPQGNIRYVTDINPNRHDYFMPKSAQRIVSPRELGQIAPDLVVVMNGIYEGEIRADLASMGLQPEIRCL